MPEPTLLFSLPEIEAGEQTLRMHLARETRASLLVDPEHYRRLLALARVMHEMHGLLQKVWDDDMARDHDEATHDAIGQVLARVRVSESTEET